MFESDLFFKIIFFKPVSKQTSTTPQLPGTTRQKLPATTRQKLAATTRQLPDTSLKQFDSYPEKAKKIIEFIQETPYITRKELASNLAITENGVKYHIKNLTHDGIIKRVDNHWIIC